MVLLRSKTCCQQGYRIGVIRSISFCPTRMWSLVYKLFCPDKSFSPYTIRNCPLSIINFDSCTPQNADCEKSIVPQEDTCLYNRDRTHQPVARLGLAISDKKHFAGDRLDGTIGLFRRNPLFCRTKNSPNHSTEKKNARNSVPQNKKGANSQNPF